jgi:hypothetical protein
MKELSFLSKPVMLTVLYQKKDYITRPRIKTRDFFLQTALFAQKVLRKEIF